MDREEKQAKIKKICSALNNNGIDVDKDFPNIIKRGYGGDGCQELSDNLVEDIYGLVVQGVNDGFANEEVIKDLMDIAVELDDPKKEKKLSSLKKYTTPQSKGGNYGYQKRSTQIYRSGGGHRQSIA